MSFFKPKAAKSTQSSLSENTNNSLLTGMFTPGAQTGMNALQQLGGALNGGWEQYADNAGYGAAMRQLGQNITGQGAAAGLLNSGSTTKALAKYGTELNSQMYNNYLQQLGALAGLGNQAGQLIANVGQKSTSSGSSNGGGASDASTTGNILGTIGTLFSLSDRRLKRDIRKLGERPDGLGIYSYRMVTTTKRILGVMADEVARLRPDALGPKVHGFQTVNYGAL